MLRLVSERVEGPDGVVGLLQVQICDVRVGVVFVAACEGRLPRHELVGEDADRPEINLVIVGFLVDELGGHIVNSATESCPPLVNRVGSPAEIAKFNCHLLEVSDQNILRLYVPMDHVTFLQVQQSVDDLADDMLGLFLSEALLTPQLLV